MSEDYVSVPRRAAEALQDVIEISEKGHNAEVKYVKRDDEWVVYDVDKTKVNRRAG